MRTAAAALAVVALAGCTDPWWFAARDNATAKGLPCADHAALIDLAGLPDHFHYVADRESNCWPGAINSRSGATGLFQIMPMWADDCGTTRHGLLDGFTNAVCAAHIYAVQGPDAWSQTWG
jgi:hypothetical protein